MPTEACMDFGTMETTVAPQGANLEHANENPCVATVLDHPVIMSYNIIVTFEALAFLHIAGKDVNR